MYVYIQSEDALWTVGFYDNDGDWQPESDHDSPVSAARRVGELNGGAPQPRRTENAYSNQNPPICPLLSTQSVYDECKGVGCAWWNIDLGMCAIAALAEVRTSELVRQEMQEAVDLYRA